MLDRRYLLNSWRRPRAGTTLILIDAMFYFFKLVIWKPNSGSMDVRSMPNGRNRLNASPYRDSLPKEEGWIGL